MINMMYPITACSLPQLSLPTGKMKWPLSDMCALLVAQDVNKADLFLFCVSGTGSTTHHSPPWEL